MIIAVDHGNLAIKTPHCSFPSGLTEHAGLPPLSLDRIKYEGLHYTLSGERIPYMRNKTKDNRFFILTLFAIAKECDFLGINLPSLHVDLAVGLPPEHYATLQNDFAQYFMCNANEPVRFDYNERHINLHLNNTFVFPQCFAAIATRSKELEEYSRTFVVDIGGYTTDVLLMRGGKPDLQYFRSLEIGVITMFNDIKGKISAQYDILIDEDHIVDILQGRKNPLPDDVKKITFTETERHTVMILNRLRELGIDLRANHAVFVGGGSVLLKPYIEASGMAGAVDFNDDVHANAHGYRLLATARLHRQGNVS